MFLNSFNSFFQAQSTAVTADTMGRGGGDIVSAIARVRNKRVR